MRNTAGPESNIFFIAHTIPDMQHNLVLFFHLFNKYLFSILTVCQVLYQVLRM